MVRNYLKHKVVNGWEIIPRKGGDTTILYGASHHSAEQNIEAVMVMAEKNDYGPEVFCFLENWERDEKETLRLLAACILKPHARSEAEVIPVSKDSELFTVLDKYFKKGE